MSTIDLNMRLSQQVCVQYCCHVTDHTDEARFHSALDVNLNFIIKITDNQGDSEENQFFNSQQTINARLSGFQAARTCICCVLAVRLERAKMYSKSSYGQTKQLSIFVIIKPINYL